MPGRGRAARIGGAEDGYARCSYRGGEVHWAGVVGYQKIQVSENRGELREVEVRPEDRDAPTDLYLQLFQEISFVRASDRDQGATRQSVSEPTGGGDETG